MELVVSYQGIQSFFLLCSFQIETMDQFGERNFDRKSNDSCQDPFPKYENIQKEDKFITDENENLRKHQENFI